MRFDFAVKNVSSEAFFFLKNSIVLVLLIVFSYMAGRYCYDCEHGSIPRIGLTPRQFYVSHP